MSFLLGLEFVAVVVSAIYGILLAVRQGMNFVGVFAVACVASFGGGTLRDLFLDRTPLFWVGQPARCRGGFRLHFGFRVHSSIAPPDSPSVAAT